MQNHPGQKNKNDSQPGHPPAGPDDAGWRSGARPLRIGTRGSQLALTQANMVRTLLVQAHPVIKTEIIEIKTSGDWQPQQGETRLSEAQGGKGLFAREIERALLDGAIDCAVHSMKDMASFLPDGLVIDHMLPREDPRDAFISNKSNNIEELPEGAVVGTASTRRQAFLLARRPDLRVVPFRGNVPTRIEKLRRGQVDATLLAMAGLKRLGLEAEIACVLAPEEMLPAAGQGAIGIETRAGDRAMHEALAPLSCRATVLQVKAERAALQVLDGSCHTPIGAYATFGEDDKSMTREVAVASPDGKAFYDERATGIIHDVQAAEELGSLVGSTVKARLPEGFLA